jgi:hypothetical protein
MVQTSRVFASSNSCVLLRNGSIRLVALTAAGSQISQAVGGLRRHGRNAVALSRAQPASNHNRIRSMRHTDSTYQYIFSYSTYIPCMGVLCASEILHFQALGGSAAKSITPTLPAAYWERLGGLTSGLVGWAAICSLRRTKEARTSEAALCAPGFKPQECPSISSPLGSMREIASQSTRPIPVVAFSPPLLSLLKDT